METFLFQIYNYDLDSPQLGLITKNLVARKQSLIFNYKFNITVALFAIFVSFQKNMFVNFYEKKKYSTYLILIINCTSKHERNLISILFLSIQYHELDENIILNIYNLQIKTFFIYILTTAIAITMK